MQYKKKLRLTPYFSLKGNTIRIELTIPLKINHNNSKKHAYLICLNIKIILI